jgi:hypothetical protein
MITHLRKNAGFYLEWLYHGSYFAYQKLQISECEAKCQRLTKLIVTDKAFFLFDPTTSLLKMTELLFLFLTLLI